MKHECCEEASWFLRYDVDDNYWYISIDAGYTHAIGFCPWCGVRLATTAPDRASRGGELNRFGRSAFGTAKNL